MTLLVQERPTLTVAVTMSASVECYPGSQASPCWQAGRLRFHTWLLLSYGNILVINQDSLSVHVTLWLTLVQQTCAVILYLQNYCIANLSWFSHFISAKNQQFWPLIGGVMNDSQENNSPHFDRAGYGEARLGKFAEHWVSQKLQHYNLHQPHACMLPGY